MKQFYKYILTLVALQCISSNMWGECTITETYNNVTATAEGKWYNYESFGNITLCSPPTSNLKVKSITMTIKMDGSGTDKGFEGSLKTNKGTYGTCEVSRNSTKTFTFEINKTGITTFYIDASERTYSKNRTVVISNIKVVYECAPTFNLDEIDIRVDDTPIGHSSTKTFTIGYNNSAQSVNLVSSEVLDANGFFAISPSTKIITNGTGDAEYTITFTPTSSVTNATAQYIVKGEGETKVTINVTGTSFDIVHPEYTCNIADSYMVDDPAIDLDSLWTSTSTATKNYKIETWTPSGSNNTNAVQPTISNNLLSLGQAGTIVLSLSQSETTGYYAGSDTKTIIINKYNTNTITNDLATEYMVDDVIVEEDIYTINKNEVPVEIISGNENILKFENGQLEAVNAGTTTITVKQTETYKWVGISATKKITIKKHTISAAISQSTAVWNELIEKPFSASSTHPVSGQVTAINDFTVTQVNNTHIATLNNSTYDVQTYYTNGLVYFRFYRAEDRKYNELDQQLSIAVNASTAGCNVLNTLEEQSYSAVGGGEYESIEFIGTPYQLTFDARQTWSAVGNNKVEEYVNGQWKPVSTLNLSDTYSSFGPYNINENATKIRFYTSPGSYTRYFKNIIVTRKQSIEASTTSLTLDTTAINLPVSKSFTLDWSTCSDEIILTHNNPRFSLNTYKIDASDVKQGTTTITVTCDAEVVNHHKDTIIIYDQSRSIPIPIKCLVNDKSIAEIKGATSHSMQVDSIWETGFEFIKTSYDTPTNNTADYFYYTISNNFGTNTYRKEGYPNDVITFDPETKKVYAHNAGTAVLTIIQQENAYHYTDTLTCTITVAKHTPEFTWQDPVYFNKTIADYFTTNNTDTEISITQPSTDTDVAVLYFDPNNANDKHTLDLTTYYKETTPASSTTVTVAQAEDYYWYAHSEPHTIIPTNEDNHVQFTLTQQNYINVFQHSYLDPAADSPMGPDWNNGIEFGGENILGGNEGWSWSDKYTIIQFTGIPDSLLFTTSTDGTATTGTNSDLYFYVSEGQLNNNGEITYTNKWNYTKQNNNVALKLNPDTRFLKLCYTGNLRGYFKNVTVTEFNEFNAIPDTLNFGKQFVDNPDTTLTFDFKFANAGYKVQLESTDTLFTVSTNYIDTIGGEKHGTVKNIQVTYHPTRVHNTNATGAKILIWDEVGHRDTIHLVANTIKSTPTLDWAPEWKTATIPIIQQNKDIFNAAISSNGYATVKYRSSNDTIIQITNNGTAFRGLKPGEQATIIAYQEADSVYNEAESTPKTFKVTDKLMQYILWEDNLLDFCLGDEGTKLTAQVWVMTDAQNNTWEYSPEQTKKIKYSSPNPSVANVTDSTLTIVGIGEMFLEAYIEEDTTYERAAAQIPVRVRDCSIACTDADLIIPVINSDGETMMPEDKFEYNPYLGQTQKIVKIDRDYGIPGSVTFAYHGREAWGTLAGKIRVWESTDNQATWQQVLSNEDAITPIAQQAQYSRQIPLSRNATHIKFERFDGVNFGYHIIQYITVLPAKYIESTPDDIDWGNIYVGNMVDTTITISYSSMRAKQLEITKSHDNLSSNTTKIEGDCGDWGTTPLTITLNSDISIIGPFKGYIAVSDAVSGIADTIHITANIVKSTPTITWNPTDTIRSSAEWETKKTATSSSGNQVLYEITKGNQDNEFAYLNDQGKMILLRGGTITARAYTQGTNTSNEGSNYHDFLIIVDPLFEDFDNDSNWLNDNNWNIGRTPWANDSATIQSGKTVTLNTHITTQGVEFEEGSSIHITSTGGLTVGAQGITNAATDGSSIIINNLHNGAGFLRISPEYQDEMPKVTMRYQTRSTLDNGANKDATWQYFGAPGDSAQFTVDYITWLYHWSETKGWLNQKGTVTLQPFAGYAITQYGKPTYSIVAQPINTNQTIQLTKTSTNGGMDGDNLFANSFMAPIDVKNFTDDDFKGDMDKTFYIYNSGSWNQWNGQNEKDSTLGGNSSTTPGQYCAIPALSAPYLDSEYDITTLPPMQGVYVVANADGASIQLDYNKHVWQAGSYTDGTTNMNEPMRAPQRAAIAAMQHHDFRRVRIQLNSANSGADRLYIIQEQTTTRDYDNGYDAPNQFAEGLANIYTNEPFGKMEVSCANNIDSIYIGFQAGADTCYTLSFNALIGDTIYLQDHHNDSIITLTQEGRYLFHAQPYSINDTRFQLLLQPNRQNPDNEPNNGITTDLTTISNARIWYSNQQLYITNAPINSLLHIYNMSGQHILSTHVPLPNYYIPIYLPNGIYIVQLNQQRLKLVCQ